MALLPTYKLTANTQSFSEDRHMEESSKQEGVKDAGDFKVTPGGASLQWSVAAGVAWIQGDTTARQGLYEQVNDAAVTGTVAAGHATLPRMDKVVLQIADSSVTGASNTPTLATLTGTATSGTTLDNGNDGSHGAPTVPATALLLADVLVPATHSGALTTAMIRDRRKWARGAFRSIVRNANAAAGSDYTVTALAGGTALDATNLAPRVECSGLPIRASLRGLFSHGTVSARSWVRVVVDGSALDGGQQHGIQAAATGSNALGFYMDWVFTPSAGSHVIRVEAWTDSGTLTIRAAAANPLEFVIEELFRQNASND